MSKKFAVYKSSAGSGKTTTLVKEYLTLSLKNPDNFHQILAITFTNKAANEMKTRIVETLKHLSLQEENALKQELARATALPEAEIPLRAARLLWNITHRYDEFAVSTIDAFIHQIVRTFSPDLKLPQGFEVLIDKDDIVPFIVEEIYARPGTDKAFTQILLQFILARVDDEKAYDLNKTLSEFVEKQLQEEESHTENLAKYTPDYFLQQIKQLKNSLAETKKFLIQQASEGLEIIAQAGLSPSDFKGKSNSVAGYLTKIKNWPAKPKELSPNKNTINALEKEEWYSKTTKQPVKTAIESILPELREKLERIRENVNRYLFLILVYDNIYEMALMGEIKRLFENFTQRTRKVHISEFNKRIHKEISGQPIPFIYERLGRRYHHFLIDEFQDTSVLQWENLLPLLEESLANGFFNMVVGDAKQSIYRFRNGEVELFTHLPDLYGVEDTPENRQRAATLKRNYVEKKLEYNYRSRKEIIRFNNRFFTVNGSTLKGELQQVYQDVEQKFPEKAKENGWVSLDFIPAENTEDFRKKRLGKILDIVHLLQDKNYPVKDICVLTLKNDAAAEIAAHLLQHQIPVVTSESLLLTTSPVVRFTVAAMKLLTDEQNTLWFAEFLTAFLQDRHQEDRFHSLFAETAGQNQPMYALIEKFNLQLPSSHTLRTQSVYEIASTLLRNLANTTAPDPFVQHFLDFILEKESVYYGSLAAFLPLWEEKKDKQSIVIPEGVDAVQIMTAHKAKGLKFGTVIADLYNMSTKLTRKQYWEETTLPELKNISPVLLNISKENLAAAGKTEIYEQERARTDMDFLNKVYVAFTRPVDALFIISSQTKRSSDAFSRLLKHFLEKTEQLREEEIHYEWGTFPQDKATRQETNDNILYLSKNFSKPWQDFIEMAPADEESLETAGDLSPRSYGKLLHALLSKIKTGKEAEKQVDQWLFTGRINADEAKTIKKIIRRVVSHPGLKPYFASGTVVQNETELFDAESGTLKRPDRVVIHNGILTILDYKTGARNEASEKKYRRQVNTYAQLFKRLGYSKIEQKLVYIHPENIEVVDVE